MARLRHGMRGHPQAERAKFTPEQCADAEAAFASGRPYNDLIFLSTHCVDQYRDRFRPDMLPGEAKGELYRRLREVGFFALSPPVWHISSNKASIGYVTIDDEMVLPVVPNTARKIRAPYVATTCLYRVL